jgi:hypothetical protein
MWIAALAPFLWEERRLAVNGDQLSRSASERGHPGHEAMLELDSIQGGKDVTRLVMRGRPIAKRQKPAQKIEFLLTKQRNIDEALDPGEHGQQTNNGTSPSG